jgi:protein-disulfide isomerase
VKYFLTVLIAACFLTGSTSFAAAEGLSKEQRLEVEQMMHDYIVKHPDLIMKSVDDFNYAESQKRFKTGLAENRDQLFKDATSPFMGNAKGDVTIIEFFDYNCGYCKKVFPEIRALLEDDKNLKVIFREVPILGPTSETAARWALAAQMQDKYFSFHRAAMEVKGKLTDAAIEEAAKSAGMDVAKAKTDAESETVTEQIKKNRELFSKIGFTGTPAFVVNDVALGGVGKVSLKQLVDEARQKAGAKP